MARAMVSRKRAVLAWGCWLGAAICWGVAFFAGHDVWQAMGRPDYWRGEGVGAFDLRVFAWAFYLMPWLGLGALVAGCVCRGRSPGWSAGNERELGR